MPTNANKGGEMTPQCLTSVIQFHGGLQLQHGLQNNLFGPCFGVKSSVSPLFQALVWNSEDLGLRKQLHNVLLNQFRTSGASADSELL